MTRNRDELALGGPGAAETLVSERLLLRVVLIEDDEDLLPLLVAELEERGHEVMAFEDAEKAMAFPELGTADVVLTDYQLPGFDGLALCEYLQHVHPLIPVVVMTAHSSTETAIAAVQNGAADYVLKPTNGEAVDERLQRAVNESRKRERRRSKARRVKLHGGRRVGSSAYQLVRWIGDGGMGSVFEAQHVETERRVALKILHADQCRHDHIVKTFRNEARASARIGAPNIVDILDFIELDDGRLMLVMEYLDGADLAEEIESGRMTLPRMLAIIRQMCRGLGAAHEANIVHRDVKPDNVMLIEREGLPDFVKIVDFGISCFTAEPDQPRTISGTPAYMAPELIRGQPFDGRADVYGMACVVYEFLTGEPPFGREERDAARGHVLTRPTRPTEKGLSKGVSLSPSLERVVMRCLAKKPENRPESMDTLESEIAAIQKELGSRDAWSSRLSAGQTSAAPPKGTKRRWFGR